jgi:hypothetical protein
VNTEEQKIFDEGRLIGLLSSRRTVLVSAKPFFETKGLTSISILDPDTETGFTFDISNVRIEEKLDEEEE